MKKSNVFSFILGAVIFGSIGVLATSSILASNISFEPTDTEWNVSTVQEAINDLYNRTGTMVSTIPGLLASANINKNYTTINEVLADTSTLETLINTPQSCNYLAASTDWATSVANNEDAMTYIGANDSCADKLYSEVEWAKAMASSQYYDKVLEPLVPPMTSSTQPSGQVTAISCYGGNCDTSQYAAWHAFTGVDTGVWEDSWQSQSATNPWITYMFPQKVSAVKIYMSFLKAKNATSIFNNGLFKVQASNDNSNWTDLTDTIAFDVSIAEATATFNTNAKYQYYRFYWVTPNQGGGYGNVGMIQYYGR